MSIVAIPLLVAIVGALVYALSSNPKASELGRIAFSCGLLVAVYIVAGEKIRLP